MKTKYNIGFKPSHITLANPHNPRKREIDIEELLRWTYQDQQADVVISKLEMLEHGKGMVCQTAVVSDLLAMGCHIDNSKYKGAALHPDAEAVHDALCTLKPEVIGLVLAHAKTASRPDLMGEADISHLIESDPYSCQNLIGFERGIYSAWWQGMARLVSIIGELKDYEICGPQVSSQPWVKK